jgi:hypothetical protein
MIWEDPPAPVKKPLLYTDEVEAMRQQPRKWMRLVERGSSSSARTLASEINRGVHRVFTPAGDFESEHRGCFVYARYLGDGYGDRDL